MTNQLSQLRQFTTVVADTGDITAIEKYRPQDATTNPSLVLQAASLPHYQHLIAESIEHAKAHQDDKQKQLELASDYLAVNIGQQILNLIPGRISTEVDARLSYDTQASIKKARQLVQMYNDKGIRNDRILIKLAATWQGIKAAEVLEKEGINCNLTLLFSFAQSRACAEAGVYLISPFVGRILDWYKQKEGKEFIGSDDPGVQSVSKIYQYYKQHDYQTVVMGASFRNKEEILQLAGCDRLTIGPSLLQQLEESEDLVEPQLTAKCDTLPKPTALTEAEFLWAHHQDPMAVEKLAEGIRNFAADQEKLESMLTKAMFTD